MRQILDLDFPQLMGRFGNWPTDASIQACEAIVRLAKQCLQGATFVDVGVTTGKTTVCLAHAAYRLGGKVIAVSTQTNQPVLAGWFNRAMLLFKTTGYVVNTDGANQQADFIVAREGAPMREIYTNGLKPNGVLFVLGNDALLDQQPLEKGVGYAAWRKDEIRAPRLGSQTLASQVSDDSVTTDEQPKPMSGQRDNVGPYDEAVIRTVVGDTNGVQHESTVADDRVSASNGILSAAEGIAEQSNETPHDASASENTPRNGKAEQAHQPKRSKQKVVSLLTPDKI